jgi:hypothetical protein
MTKGTVMEDYQEQDWVSLYQAALTELEHAKMTGRVEAARTAIIARMEKLQTLPDCILTSISRLKTHCTV